MRVVVVGAGIHGLSIAWAFARAGHQVTVIDQGPIPNPAASSFDDHRLIRHAYGAEAGYTRMVDQAFSAWEQVWRDVGRRLYHPTGTLAIAFSGHGWVRDSLETLTRLGHRAAWMGPAELGQRFPMIETGDAEGAILLGTGGALLATPILRALAEHLAGRGVTLRPHARVAAVDPERAVARLDGGESVGGDVIAVCAGAWIGRLVPEWTTRVVPSRQAVVYLDPPDDLAPRWAIQPMVIALGASDGLYLVPPVAGTPMKAGDHTFSRRGDPDDGREADEEEVASILAACRKRVKGFARYAVRRRSACYYSVTDDERFIVEPIGGRAWALSPCSGHGFKFGPAIGLAVVEATLGRRRGEALVQWAAGRG
ncbi:MAG: NAD(P)/FAD-dependent oxidoreductase [Alphaproteobacteria bacterium]